MRRKQREETFSFVPNKTEYERGSEEDDDNWIFAKQGAVIVPL
jgi:hypothetical protein